MVASLESGEVHRKVNRRDSTPEETIMKKKEVGRRRRAFRLLDKAVKRFAKCQRKVAEPVSAKLQTTPKPYRQTASVLSMCGLHNKLVQVLF